MADHDEVEINALDYQVWTLDQRGAFKARVLHSAQAARSECLKSALRLLALAPQRISTLVGRAWRAHTARRRRQTEIVELRGFDERMLRDIGITRLDVNTIAQRQFGVQPTSKFANTTTAEPATFHS